MFFFKKKTADVLTVLPAADVCPGGDIIPATPGKSVVEILLKNDIEISHSCQMQCSCTTCHVFVMEGGQYLTPMTGEETRMLNKTGNRTEWSRLGCQAVFEGGGNVTIEIAG